VSANPGVPAPRRAHPPEIERERYAIKALRGDFDGVPPSGSADAAARARAALAAVDR
jgi:hypothetical protein